MSRIAYTILFNGETEENAEGLNFLHLMDIDQVYSEGAENKNKERNRMLSSCRKGDEILCRSISSCSKDHKDFISFAHAAEKYGVNLLCIEDEFDLSRFRSKYLLAQMEQEPEADKAEVSSAPAAAAEMEGTSEGTGRRGRRPKEVNNTEFVRLYAQLSQKQITKKEMQNELGISYPTLMKLISAKEAEC